MADTDGEQKFIPPMPSFTDGPMVPASVLADALEGMREMSSQVSPYFQEKHDHAGYIERAQVALEASKPKPPQVADEAYWERLDAAGPILTEEESVDLQEFLEEHRAEWKCPNCGATTRARMADATPLPGEFAEFDTSDTDFDRMLAEGEPAELVDRDTYWARYYENPENRVAVGPGRRRRADVDRGLRWVLDLLWERLKGGDITVGDTRRAITRLRWVEKHYSEHAAQPAPEPNRDPAGASRPGDITVDHEAGAACIYLWPVGPGGVARSREVGDSVVVDYDADGNVVSVELLTLEPFLDARDIRVRALREYYDNTDMSARMDGGTWEYPDEEP